VADIVAVGDINKELADARREVVWQKLVRWNVGYAFSAASRPQPCWVRLAFRRARAAFVDLGRRHPGDAAPARPDIGASARRAGRLQR